MLAAVDEYGRCWRAETAAVAARGARVDLTVVGKTTAEGGWPGEGSSSTSVSREETRDDLATLEGAAKAKTVPGKTPLHHPLPNFEGTAKSNDWLAEE